MVLRILRTTLNTLSLVAAVALGVGAAVLHFEHGQLLSVQTGSMTPVINKGDLVVVTRVPESHLAVGDVVTYVSPLNPKKTLTHRIIKIHGQQITARGDANAVADPVFNASAIVGQVKAHVRYAGYALDFSRKPLGLMLLIYVPALTIVIAEVKRLSAAYRKAQPYVAAGVLRHTRARFTPPTNYRAMAGKVCVALAMVSLGIARPVQAALSSTVVLQGNTIATGQLHHQCSGSTNNNIVINNSTTQIATSGNSSGSSATSGNASTTSNTGISITITNC